MRQFNQFLALSLFLIAIPVRVFAQGAAAEESIRPNSLCPMIESAARANNLPIEFFTRLIWQESRFRSDEIGPQTRSGEHALGIAQFMPATAIEHGLFDPFNPVVALPKSGEFLAELRNDFGNLGLAAAAYNAGPQRVRDYIAGLHDLPTETRNYVLVVTGHPVEDWIKAENGSSLTIDAGLYAEPNENAASCTALMTVLNKPTSPLIAQAELNVPSWCKSLEHPNLSVCGPVHERPRGSGLALGQVRFGYHRGSIHLTQLRR